MRAPAPIARRSQRFLEALVRELGPDAAALLREWADDLDRIAREVEVDSRSKERRRRTGRNALHRSRA